MPGAGRVQPPDRLPDPYRTRRPDTERHHERDAGNVQDDLMRRQGGRRQPAGERRHRREHPDLQGHLHGGRQTERAETAQTMELESARHVPQPGAMPVILTEDRQEQKQRQIDP